MEITVLRNGIFGSNTYIVSSNKECAVIDCGNKASDIINEIRKRDLNLKYIILTHGHMDHVYYANQLKDETDSTLCIHEQEIPLYEDPNKNGYNSFGFSEALKLADPDKFLKDGDELSLGDETLQIIHTPGHSPGCVCILIAGCLFTGDTLFQSSVGRTDLYGGSWSQLENSIKSRIYTLDEGIKVYPGHGMDTTIGFERENNPYV